MACRRRHGLSRSSTFNEGIRRSPDDDDTTTTSFGTLPHRGSDPRLDSFRSGRAFHLSFKNRSKGAETYDYTSMKSTNEPRGFWGVLARKAKAILEDEVPQQSKTYSSVKPHKIGFSKSSQFTGIQSRREFESYDNLKKTDSPALSISLDRLKSSLNQIEISRKTLEADKNTQNLNQETPKMQNSRMVLNKNEKQDRGMQSVQQQKKQETQLQASRDVTVATASKVKQLGRELKTLKEELAKAKEQCCQLEEENKKLYETHEKEDYPADDDMIRVQLETLLAEKGRLAHENSVYALENRYLREIVEFHQQLSMQDMVYLDESNKGVSLPTTPTETTLNPLGTPSSSKSV
ncbi:uncharacterized protein [Rutidosis leptorrhynchoides]|uniref:uncharacterized protein n=1 Tax=Rutidosis leptorrhynchoides TaxID=125765 RepID=UPI003A98E067